MEDTINRTPLQIEIIQYIKDYIKKYNLSPGDRLPSQEKLCEMMSVSRPSLREAVKTLEARNLLEIQNGRGVFVKKHQEEGVRTELVFTKEKEQYVEIIEVRKALEHEMLKLVVEKATDKELDQLGKVVEELMRKYRLGVRQNAEDYDFHHRLYQMSHHRVYIQVVQSLGESMDKLWECPLDMDAPFTVTIPLHEQLYFALRKRDAKAAIEINDKILDEMIDEINERNIVLG